MCSISAENEDNDAHIGDIPELAPDDFLAPICQGAEGQDARPRGIPVPLLAIPVPEPAVAVPNSKAVVGDEAQTGGDGERCAHPCAVGDAPDDLAPELGVAGDAHDALFVDAESRALDGGDLGEVEGGRVEEEEGDECGDPDGGVEARDALEAPELEAVVAVGDEVGDDDARAGERDEGEEDAVGALADDGDGSGAERGEAGVCEGEAVDEG